MEHSRLLLVLALVFAPVLVYHQSDSRPFTEVSPPNGRLAVQIPPMVTFIAPSDALAGGPAFSLTVNGTDFVPTSIVQWNGADRTTTFFSPTQLTAMIAADDIASGGAVKVTVVNPFSGNAISNAVIFTVNNPVPMVFGLSPASAIVGGPSFLLTLNGANFVRGSIAQWNGLPRPTSFISSTQITATISTSDIAAAGWANVSVLNPDPRGGTSPANRFAIKEPDNPAPSIISISPNSATAGSGWLSLTVIGSGFVNSSTVQWNGINRNTTFISATQLTVSIYATDIGSAGTAWITVFNPAPGGGTSNSQTFTIRPRSIPPSAAGTATPASVKAGGTVLLIVKVTPGSNPASTDLKVTANLTLIGGSSTQLLYDDGTHGDATPGDNTFSFRAAVPANTSNGNKILPVIVMDAQGRRATTSIQLTVGPVNQKLGSAPFEAKRAPDRMRHQPAQ